jgi:arsenate reductase-like glutaredoxin family protein
MRTIKGQTIASTTLDLHDDKITKEELVTLFNQMPAEQVVNLDHDLSKPIGMRCKDYFQARE